MIKGNLWKNIFLYSLPLIFTNLLQLLFNICDIAVAGKFAGPVSLGAVGSTALLISLTTGCFIGIGNGINAVTAFFTGAGDEEKAGKASGTGLILSLATGFTVCFLGIFFSFPVLKLLGTKEELIGEAVLYFRIYMLGSPALSLFNYGSSVLSARGNTRKPLLYLTIAGIINIFLNLYFVIILKRQSDGVACASIISQYISALLVLHSLKGYIGDFDLKVLKQILKIGLPAAIQYSLFSLSNLFVQGAVNSLSTVYVEGNSAAMNYDSLVYEMMAAFYTACSSFTAQNFGAGMISRVKKTYIITSVYSFTFAFFAGILIFVFKEPLLYLFTNESGIVSAGSVRLSIMSASYCLSAFMDNATAFLRGLGKTFFSTIAVFSGTVVFRIIWVNTVFRILKTPTSLYLLYGTAFTLTAAALNIYIIKSGENIWKTDRMAK